MNKKKLDTTQWNNYVVSIGQRQDYVSPEIVNKFDAKIGGTFVHSARF